MTLDALDIVTTAEAQAEARLAAAAAEARKLLAEADADGLQMLRAAEAEAEETVEALISGSEQRAAALSRSVALRTEEECQTLRDAAHGRMAAAVRLVVERIVSGP